MWNEQAMVALPTSHRQTNWSKPLFEQSSKDLHEKLDNHGKARFLGCSAPGSGAWLNCLPSAPLGLRMSNEQIRVAVSIRLGASVSLPHTCLCGAECDSYGNHALVCKKVSGRQMRHRLCNTIIMKSLNACGHTARLEPQGLSLENGSRPDGITQIPWSQGRPAVWDFTCSHRLAVSWNRCAIQEGSAVAERREQAKITKYEELVSQNGGMFFPVAAETLGGLGPKSLDFLRNIGQRTQALTGDARATSFLLQRLSVAIQIGNTVCIQESLPREEDEC